MRVGWHTPYAISWNPISHDTVVVFRTIINPGSSQVPLPGLAVMVAVASWVESMFVASVRRTLSDMNVLVSTSIVVVAVVRVLRLVLYLSVNMVVEVEYDVLTEMTEVTVDVPDV